MTRKKQKRPAINSDSETTRIFAASYLDLKPPAHTPLKKHELPFFDSVIAEQAKADWTDHTLEIAALLARTMSELQIEQIKMQGEGSILKTGKNYSYINPRKALIDSYTNNIFAYRRSLSLHARVQGANKKDVAARKDKAKEIEKLAEGLNGGLINRPRPN